MRLPPPVRVRRGRRVDPEKAEAYELDGAVAVADAALDVEVGAVRDRREAGEIGNRLRGDVELHGATHERSAIGDDVTTLDGQIDRFAASGLQHLYLELDRV